MAGLKKTAGTGSWTSSASTGPAPGPHTHAPLTWRTASHPWKGEQVVACLCQALPGLAGHPRLVVLNHASCHRAHMVHQARRQLAECGICLWYLPTYSPEWNASERTVQHGAMPQRTFTATRTLTAAVKAAFEHNAQLASSK